MPVFKTADELQAKLGGFFKHLIADPQIGTKLQASKLKLRFEYKTPNTNIWIDLSEDPATVSFEPPKYKPDIHMTLSGDMAHKFWQGELNLVSALARRQITAKGPIPKILKLLPIIKPAFGLYRKYLDQFSTD